MGYLDGTSVTVDAVLTKKGREILSKGEKLDVTSFTCTDTGVDYTLWNPDHPSGSAYYGEAIENLPMLEASVHSAYSMKNRLISLSQNTVAVPALELSGHNGTHVHTFDSNKALTMTVTIIGFSGTAGTVGAAGGISFIIQDPNLVMTNASANQNISGTTRQFLREADIAGAIEYGVTGTGNTFSFNVTPIQQDTTGRETSIYVVHNTTGAYAQIRLINNVTKPDQKNISPASTIGG